MRVNRRTTGWREPCGRTTTVTVGPATARSASSSRSGGPAAGVLAVDAEHLVARGDEVAVQPPFTAGLRRTALEVDLGPAI